MKSKETLKQELEALRKQESTERRELSQLLISSNKPRAECLTDCMIDIALVEAKCEILEWVLEDLEDED